ncbi:MAG: hypothetical protein IJU04_05265 [Ruminococcus sp.]|nr:hypothetical protein [Ruminococcus sp.]
MLHGLIDIPTIHYFEENNIWTGSLFERFNYRITPVRDDAKAELLCQIWYGRLCYDLTESFEAENTEAITADGLKKTIDFINSEALKYKESH